LKSNLFHASLCQEKEKEGKLKVKAGKVYGVTFSTGSVGKGVEDPSFESKFANVVSSEVSEISVFSSTFFFKEE